MTMTSTAPRPAAMPAFARPGFFTRIENWLDARGRPAWIIAMVLGFILFWPIGLGLLAYMIWGKRMFGRAGAADLAPLAMKSSGNTAFDAYRHETLRRLEEEQQSFENFLDRLREAKDKAEFDAFMQDRAAKARADSARAAAQD